MTKNPKFITKHLSLRVPWHDNSWNGTVCNNPDTNGACLILKNCALNRDDGQEVKNSGLSIKNLSEEQYPTCVGERGTFMAPFSYTRIVEHPYAKSSKETHGHLKPTNLYFPAYSAPAVPFDWMLKSRAEERTDYDLDYNQTKEPKLKFTDNWIQAYDNQKTMLNTFFEHFEEEKSLVFFYAKKVPFIEENGRVLVGVGRIKRIIASKAYEGSNEKFSCAYWEHMVEHSIRPEFNDGFLLPYHDALNYAKENFEFNPADLAVVIPADKTLEFSYAAEHVGNDTSIRILLSCIQSLEKAKNKNIGSNHEKIIQWIHDRISEIQKLRGNYPGMGSALCALGIDKGHFVAAGIINNIDENQNPWEVFYNEINGKSNILSNDLISLIHNNIKEKFNLWIENKSLRLELLYLLSRFDISQEQAKIFFIKEIREKQNINLTDNDIIENPYSLYEQSLYLQEPINITTIDFGIFSSKNNELFPKSFNMKDPLDKYRIRALTIQQLEYAINKGHTLLPRQKIVNNIRDLAIEPQCNVSGDDFEISEKVFSGLIEKTEMKDNTPAYQLTRIAEIGEIIKTTVTKRKKGNPNNIEDNWLELLNKALECNQIDEDEKKAREEKAKALKVLAESRISVLIGSAGTGKTTLLKTLVNQKDILEGGVLILAPTGKARIRIKEVIKNSNIQTYTLAQFLNRYERYDAINQRYILSNKKCTATYQTVIIDESSMLTEEMMGTLIDTFSGVKRFIFVGDHRQLPPIGAGRPFYDLIKFLEPDDIDNLFPKVSNCYAELTIKRRQDGSNRDDLKLAEWFSGNYLEPNADDIINKIIHNKDSEYLRFINWKDENDFQKRFENVLVEELKLKDINDVENFNKTLGSSDGIYFNWEEAVNSIENWQILSPVRENIFGVKAINRVIHKYFRQDKINYVSSYQSKLPKTLGVEEIVYGDKVINLQNKSVKDNDVYPKNGINYIANGEMGVLVGQWKTKNMNFKGQPLNTEVEFSTQKGYKYIYKAHQFGEESDPALELAYAITVHKSQGSEFGKVFLVIPNPCFLLSREMLYTALTRQKNKVIVLFQGTANTIKEFSQVRYSDTLSRITNLFEKPQMVEIEGKYLEKNLIHQASNGQLLRSKSELIIYQRLLDKQVNVMYEKPLLINNVEKLPDFTIEDDDTGEIYYWEHCGMMHDKNYVEGWEQKKQWYIDNGILPIEEGGGENGTLIISYDEIKNINNKLIGAISIQNIDNIINQIS